MILEIKNRKDKVWKFETWNVRNMKDIADEIVKMFHKVNKVENEREM